jgi:hypothetical protein
MADFNIKMDGGVFNAQDESFGKSLNETDEQTIGSLGRHILDAWDADFMGLSFLNGSCSVAATTIIIIVGSSFLLVIIHYFSSLDSNGVYGWFKIEQNCYPLKYRLVALFFGRSFTEFTQIGIFLSSEIQIAPDFVLRF